MIRALNKLAKLMLMVLPGAAFADSQEWNFHSILLVEESNHSDQIRVTFDYQVREGDHTYKEYCPVYINAWFSNDDEEFFDEVGSGVAVINQYKYNSYSMSFGFELVNNPSSFQHMGTQFVDLDKVEALKLSGPTEECLFSSGKKYRSTDFRSKPRSFFDIALLVNGKVYKGFDGRNSFFQPYLPR